jgi:hypothetical protein
MYVPAAAAAAAAWDWDTVRSIIPGVLLLNGGNDDNDPDLYSLLLPIDDRSLPPKLPLPPLLLPLPLPLPPLAIGILFDDGNEVSFRRLVGTGDESLLDELNITSTSTSTTLPLPLVIDQMDECVRWMCFNYWHQTCASLLFIHPNRRIVIG